MERVCLVGAGAVGGVLGARLAAAGVEVSVLARGKTLTSVRARGLLLSPPDGGPPEAVPVAAASDDPAALGPQELVLIAVKAHHLPALAPTLAPLITPGTVLVPALNGVPWWFFHDFGGRLADTSLAAVDPGGAVSAALPPAQVVGCVVYFAAGTVAPGHAIHTAGDRIVVGDPSAAPLHPASPPTAAEPAPPPAGIASPAPSSTGASPPAPSSSGIASPVPAGSPVEVVPGAASPRAAAAAALLRRGGFSVGMTEPIQREVWFKLWGNLTMNPISALTGAATDRILGDELVTGLVRRVMAEAAEIGKRIGCPVDQTIDERLAAAHLLGAFKTSMLQDAEAGRPLELDAVVAAVAEIGALTGTPTPYLDALFGLTRLAARERGLY